MTESQFPRNDDVVVWVQSTSKDNLRLDYLRYFESLFVQRIARPAFEGLPQSCRLQLGLGSIPADHARVLVPFELIGSENRLTTGILRCTVL